MDQKDLIHKLSALKQIKPDQSWVFSVKSDILGSAPVQTPVPATRASHVVSGVFKIPFTKVAYAFAALLVVILGGAGFFGYQALQNQHQPVVAHSNSTVSLAAPVKSNMETFKLKSRNLAEIAKANPEALPAAVEEVKDAAKDLTDALVENPESAGAVALEINNNRTYLDVEGAEDLRATTTDLYKTVVTPLLADLKEKSEKDMLTDDQKLAFLAAQKLYDEEKYSASLESILLIKKSLNEDEINKEQDADKTDDQDDQKDVQEKDNHQETTTIEGNSELKIEGSNLDSLKITPVQ